MTEAIDLLRACRHVVVQDYPSADVPTFLTRAGFQVTVYEGPDETDVVASELVDATVVTRPVGRRPDSADLLYTYRPAAERDAVLAEARRLGVQVVWRHRGPDEDDATAADWRRAAEAAGLSCVDRTDIRQAASELSGT